MLVSKRLPRAFYRRDPITVARALLGQKLVRVHNGERLAGIIVETEAYLGIPDKAAHTWNGRRTARNETMWTDGGHVYVYFTYGMHHCMNVVASRAGDPVAVLLRGLEPVEGLDLIRLHRGGTKGDTELCSGPAKLAQALAVDRSLDGTDLVTSDVITIERQRRLPGVGAGQGRIVQSRRVGIDYAEEWRDRPLRFYVADNPHVSKL